MKANTNTAETNARVAPVVDRLATVAADVHATWTRMGISSTDRQRRWDAFLHDSLLPFIDDYHNLQAAAEYNAATENDVLLREVCYLATRLDEAPRNPDVASIVVLLKRHYTRTPMQSPLLNAVARLKNAPGQAHTEKEKATYLSENTDQQTSDKAKSAEATRRSTQELMYLALPSFADLMKQPTQNSESSAASAAVKQKTTGSAGDASTDEASWIESDEDCAEEKPQTDAYCNEDKENSQPNVSIDNEGDEGHEDGDEKEEVSMTYAEKSVQQQQQRVADEQGNEEVTPRPTRLTSATAHAARSLAHMMAGNTHEGVRQQLQVELDRLKGLADNRLRVLQLLCKQRALLSCSPAEQVVLRAAYRAKYLGCGDGSSYVSDEDGNRMSELEKLTSMDRAVALGGVSELQSSGPALRSPTVSLAATMNSAAAAAAAAPPPSSRLAEPSVSPPTSSHFLSLPPSPKSSGHSLHGTTTTTTTAATTSPTGAAMAVRGLTAAGDEGSEVRCVRATTQAELQLLLSAASCTLDLQRASAWADDVNESAPGCTANEDEEEEKKLHALPSSTVERSTAADSCTQKTEAVPSVDGLAMSANTASLSSQTRSSRATTAVPSASPPQMSGAGADAGRPTIFAMDVSSITAFGTHQDLSLRRIQSEAEAIMAAIAAHNGRLQVETQAELQALETLEVLWRAMSTQKVSPKVSSSSSTSSHDAEQKKEKKEDETERASLSRRLEDSKALPASLKPAAEDPLVASLQPTPFTVSMDQVKARYVLLHEAFAADVAAQRAMKTAPLRTTVMVTVSTHPSTSAVGASQPGTSLRNENSNNTNINDNNSTNSARPTERQSSASSVPSTSPSFPSTASARTTDERASHPSPRISGGLYLPPVVRQLLRAPSYAPVFDYVHRTRLAFQKHLSTQQDGLVEKIMHRLRSVYAAYFEATGDVAYAVAPDGELRVAMEEELLETLQSSDARSSVGEGVKDTDNAFTATVPTSSTKVLQSFQRHLMACQQVREQAAEEVEFLRLRLHILDQAAPLVDDYQTILREEAEMKATSRERLLSKKVNMAKQLLQEEKVRRRVAKDLPRTVAHLTELVAAWDTLQAADVPSESSAAASTDKTTRAPTTGAVELCVHGQRVRDLLRTRSPPPQLRSGTAISSCASVNHSNTKTSRADSAAQARTRPRSVSARPPTRSVSPALPATARLRTEASRSPAPSHTRSQPLAHTQSTVRSVSGRRADSRSPSYAATTTTTAQRQRTAGPSSQSPVPRQSPNRLGSTPRRGSPTPPLRRGLSPQAANANVMTKTAAERVKAKSQSPALIPRTTAAHSTSFSTNFKSH